MAGDQRFKSLPVGFYFNQHIYKNVPQLKQNARMDELKFYDVQLLKEEVCGSGAYGRVCKAMVDQLVCAAKIIHPTFFSELDPTLTSTFHQFEKECDFLSAIRHPCIVQYLGTMQDTETGLPVLLMELMDESLTKFLDRSLQREETIPYHIQVNLCHDVCMALAFLHSNGIVHRDLSSNNILLIAGTRAKVTDFGMSTLIEHNPRMTPLTQCPGCLVYMAPEALRTPPVYSEKLDVFSMGVCIIQMITCHFPSPGDAKRTISDAVHGTIEVPIPERERRRKDIDSINPDNPLVGTALDCLADSDTVRPSAQDLCHRMIYYKSCEEYAESVDSVPALAEVLKSLEENVQEKDRQISHLHIELETKEREMASARERMQLDFQGRLVEKEREVEQLREELDRVRRNHTSQLSITSSPMRTSASWSSTLDSSLTNSLSPSEGEFERVSIDVPSAERVENQQLSIEAPPSNLWYHGPLSRMLACQRLEAASPGAYLIRESTSEQNALVLSFLDHERHVHHFKIVRNSQRQFNIGGSIWFSSLSRLVGFHSKYSSVVEKHSERLDHPVAPPVPVPLPSFAL